MQENNENNNPRYSLLQQLFSIGGITLPEGNKLAIWLLVVVVIVFISFFYFFMTIIDKVVDKALNPHSNTELVVQQDYNTLLRDAKILKAENELLKDSLRNANIDEITKQTDSVVNETIQPFINQLNRKK